MTQPPPDHDRPPPVPATPLQYYDGRRQGYAIPTVWQALIGAIGTTLLLIGGGFLLAIGALIIVSQVKGSERMFYAIVGVPSLIALAAGLLLARRLRHSDLYRGWAIGLYIGMGLAALFWAGFIVLFLALAW